MAQLLGGGAQQAQQAQREPIPEQYKNMIAGARVWAGAGGCGGCGLPWPGRESAVAACWCCTGAHARQRPAAHPLWNLPLPPTAAASATSPWPAVPIVGGSMPILRGMPVPSGPPGPPRRTMTDAEMEAIMLGGAEP